MRVCKILSVGAAVLAASLVLAGGNVVGHWKGKLKMTGTPSAMKGAPPKGGAPQGDRMGPGGRMGGPGGPGGGGGRMGGGNFDPSKVTFDLTLNANKNYVSKNSFGDRKSTTEGSWSLAGNKLTITPKTRDGKPVTGRGAEPRVLTVSADGKTIVGERPGRGGMSMKTVYTKG